MKNSDELRPLSRVGVLGAGAWGTALAQVAASAGRSVRLWAYEAEVVEGVNTSRENALYLPGVSLHPHIVAVADLEALAETDAILVVTPAQHVRGMVRRLSPYVATGRPLVMCAKGVEQGSLALMSDIAHAEVPDARIAVLSGPGFARHVARGFPTATTIACEDPDLGAALVRTIGLPTFRPYLTDDIVGAEIGGAVKNVIAIACGVAEGRKLGDGARAALITRGFAELTRFGLALGARAETLAGLCGLGDLVLTCTSLTSRNMSLGAALGEGRAMADVLSERRSVAEGASSAPAVVALAGRHGVDLPICSAVEALLAGRSDVDTLINSLLSRPFRAEGI